jgi:NADH-quinone oxidoreductase subunit J
MSVGASSLFLLCGILGLVSAVATVIARSPIRAAVGLLVHIASLAGLYLTLHAEFLALAQLIVYAGAVVVLFVFAILFIGPIPSPKGLGRLSISQVVSIGCMALWGLVFAYFLVGYSPLLPSDARCPAGASDACEPFGGVSGFADVLFRSAAFPFELVSALLTVAVVGAIMLARGRRERRSSTSEEG